MDAADGRKSVGKVCLNCGSYLEGKPDPRYPKFYTTPAEPMDAAERSNGLNLAAPRRLLRKQVAEQIRQAEQAAVTKAIAEMKAVDVEVVQAARQDERRKVLEEWYAEGAILIEEALRQTFRKNPELGGCLSDACKLAPCACCESIAKDVIRALAEEVTCGNVRWVTREEVAEMYPDPDERKR